MAEYDGDAVSDYWSGQRYDDAYFAEYGDAGDDDLVEDYDRDPPGGWDSWSERGAW